MNQARDGGCGDDGNDDRNYKEMEEEARERAFSNGLSCAVVAMQRKGELGAVEFCVVCARATGRESEIVPRNRVFLCRSLAHTHKHTHRRR